MPFEFQIYDLVSTDTYYSWFQTNTSNGNAAIIRQ